MHLDLVTNIFLKKPVSEIPQLGELDISAFAKLLPHILDETVYKSSEPYVKWNPVDDMCHSNKNVSAAWLNQVWQFFLQMYDYHFSKYPMDDDDWYSQLVSPVADWHLIPAKTEDSFYLLPLKRPDLAAKFDNNSNNSYMDPLCNAFKKMNIPSPYTDSLEEQSSVLLESMVASVNKPKELIFAIHKWQEYKVLETKFDKDEIKWILTFFTRQVDVIQHLSYGPRTIRNLALFTNCSDQIIALGDVECFTVPTDIPRFNIDLPSHNNTVFMYKCLKYDNLFKVLQIEDLETVEVYCRFIFKHFDSFGDEDRFVHMKHACHTFSGLEERGMLKERMLLALKKLPFLLKNGSLHVASAFYDPTIILFQELLHDGFPPSPYRKEICMNNIFKSVLRKMGLITKVTPSLLISLARDIEKKASSDACTDKSCLRNSLVNKSRLLLENLYKYQDTEPNLFEEMSCIQFVPLALVESDLENLHRQKCRDVNSMNFVSLANGIIQGNHNSYPPDIAWASVKLIDSSAEPCKDDICQEKMERKAWILRTMKIKEIPTGEIVVQNVTQVCLDYMKCKGRVSQIQRETLERVLENSYKFLSQHNTPEKHLLQEIPCVIVEGGNNLVCPRQLSIDMKDADEIPPYLYKMPCKLGSYKELLLELGVSAEPTMQQYKETLQEIYRRNSKKPLDHNELRNSYKAALGLMILLSHNRDENYLQGDLYLPSRAREIVKSNQLYYIDNPAISDRVQGFQSELIFEIEALQKVQKDHTEAEIQIMLNKKTSVFDIFPDNVRPKRLSEAVTEKIDEQHIERLAPEQCRLVSVLNNRFKYPAFCQGIRRLLKSSGKCEAELDLGILRMDFVVLPKVQTLLVNRDGKPVDDSSKEQKYFLQAGEERTILYLAADANERIYTMLTKSVAKVLDIPDNLHLPLCAILSCDLHEINEVLRDHKIDVDDSTENFYGLPKLGSYIPIEDHHLLCEGFEQFHEGEYVGYLIEDPDEDMEIPIYVYAQIFKIDYTASSNQLQTQCTIDIGDGNYREVSVLDLYKFIYFKGSTTSCSVVVFTGNTDGQDVHSGLQEKSLEETLEEITDILEKAWKLEECEKKKIIKRLMLKWHPDKNLDNQPFCTKVMQHIQKEIERLNSPRQRGNQGSDWTEAGPSGARNKTYDRGRASGNTWNFRHWFTRMGARARQHQRYRDEYRENLGKSAGNDFSHSFVPPSFARKNPQPRVAQRWIKQAEWDLGAAQKDQSSRPHAGSFPEWVCFKCHQAAEKALKAAQFTVDANLFTLDHNVITAAISLDNSSVLEPTRELDNLLGGSARMRYPNRCGDSIPHEVYTDAMAARALTLSKKIVELCKTFIQTKTRTSDPDPNRNSSKRPADAHPGPSGCKRGRMSSPF